GVTLANSTISGGGLVVSASGTAIGLRAESGGTVAVTGTGNMISSENRVALRVLFTHTGAAGPTLQSLPAGTAASGPTNGILLSNTGSAGGLTVTGTGQPGTGGTIQKTADSCIALSTTANYTLKSMSLQNCGNGSSDNGVRAVDTTGTSSIQS